jgi:hypothetical protein
MFDGLYPIMMAESGTALVFHFGSDVAKSSSGSSSSDGGGGGGGGSSSSSGKGGRGCSSESGAGSGEGAGAANAYGARSKINMQSNEWQTDLSPLVEGCPCVACTNYTKAYLYHLLTAHEMLGYGAYPLYLTANLP